MPSIQPLEKRQTLRVEREAPLTSGDTRIAEAASAIGATVSRLATDRIALHTRQDRANKLMNLQTEYDNRQRTFLIDEQQKTGEDSFDNQERTEEFISQQTEDLLKEVDDGELERAFRQYVSRKGGALRDNLTAHMLAQRQNVSAQVRDDRITGLLKDAYEGGDELSEFTTNWETTINTQKELGLISDEIAKDLISKGRDQIAEAYVDGLINRDPEFAIEEIQSGEFKEFMDQKTIEEFDKKAKRLIKAQEADEKRKQKEIKAAAKEEKKAAQDETGARFAKMWRQGVLTETDILKSNLSPTGENSITSWLNRLDERAKKLKDAPWETDKLVKAKLMKEIEQVDYTSPRAIAAMQDKIHSLMGAGLSDADGRQLSNDLESNVKDRDPLKKQDSKTAISLLDKARKNDLFDKNQTKNDQQWAENTIILRDWIRGNPDGDPVEFANKIIQLAVDKATDEWFTPPERKPEVLEQRKIEIDIESRTRAQGIEPGSNRVTFFDENNVAIGVQDLTTGKFTRILNR